MKNSFKKKKIWALDKEKVKILFWYLYFQNMEKDDHFSPNLKFYMIFLSMFQRVMNDEWRVQSLDQSFYPPNSETSQGMKEPPLCLSELLVVPLLLV